MQVKFDVKQEEAAVVARTWKHTKAVWGLSALDVRPEGTERTPLAWTLSKPEVNTVCW